jgi:hypothetical protein
MNTHHYISRILIEEFEQLGLARSFESLTIKEINELAKRLVEKINQKENEMDEPPF